MAETVVVGSEPAPADAPVTETPTRPDDVPEKFWDAEKGEVRTDALLKSYTELERQRGSAGNSEEDAEQDGTPADEDGGDTPDGSDADTLHNAANEALSGAGVDLATFNAEFEENGELSEASYEALDKAGFNKATVDSYIRAMGAANEVAAASVEQAASAAMEAAGGADGFKELAEWGSANLSAEDRKTYDAMIDTTDAGQMKMAVEWLVAKRAAVEGSEATPLNGAPAPTAGVKPYGSMEELRADMRDERYKRNDPAFHALVDKRLAASPALR